MSRRTAYKWLAPYRAESEAGLADRSSRPARCPHQLSEAQCEQIIALRRERRIYRHISRELGVPVGAIARLLQHAGLNRLSAFDPALPVRRYTHAAPGDLLHLELKPRSGASGAPAIA